MRLLVALAALALATPAAPEDVLPPPPPRSDEPATTTRARPRDRFAAEAPANRPGTIGEASVAPAGSQAAPLHPDEALSHWRHSLATGLTGKLGGLRLSSEHVNPRVLLYFGAQADGLWTEGFGRAARLRVRLFTGGESDIYVPSDGDVEAAFMLGRREFRFVVGRIEVGRYPALGIQTLAQAATLPCFEGSLALAGDTMRLYYYLSPVEVAWVYYSGGAHIQHSAAWATESDRPSAASAGRLRYTVLLPPALLLSLQGDLVKMWHESDLLASAEGSLGYQAFEQTAVFNLGLRANHYARRGKQPNTTARESELLLNATATLVF